MSDLAVDFETLLKERGLESYLIVAQGDGKGFFVTAGAVSEIMGGLIQAVWRYPGLAEIFCCIARTAKANCDVSVEETVH